MANWSNPLITSTYTSVLDDLKNRDIDSAVMFSPTYSTSTNVPTGAIRWNPSNRYFEIYSGTAWSALTSKYIIDVDRLDGQDGSYYLNWNNLTNKPATFAPSAHTHDDRYFTETEADARFANKLVVSSSQIKLQTFAGTNLSAITVPYATSAGSAGTVGGFTMDQNLQTTSSPTFADLTLTGIMRLKAGSASAPSLTFSDDAASNTGMFWPAENQLGFSTAGIERLHINNVGQVGVNTNNPIYTLDVSGIIGAVRYGNDPFVNLRRVNGTEASPASVSSGNILGNFAAAGYGATGVGSPAGGMVVLASENFTDTAQGAEIRFQTTPIGSATRVTRVTIDDNGSVGIGTITPSYLLHVNGSFNATTVHIAGVQVTADAAELNKLDGVTSATADLNLLSGAAAAGVTATRIQHLNSLTGNVQTQLNARMGTASPSFTGVMDGPQLLLTNGTYPSTSSTTHALQVGADSGAHLRLGGNRIQSVNAGAVNGLALNNLGGDVMIGSSTSTIYLSGSVSLVRATDDSAAAPSYSWSSNPSLGMYRASSTAIGWAIDGVNMMTLNNTNLLVNGDIVSRFYSGSAAGQTDFPIGHVLVCKTTNGTIANRNGLVVPTQHVVDTSLYVNSAYFSAGTALTGTWRSRGRIDGSDNTHLIQRVA